MFNFSKIFGCFAWIWLLFVIPLAKDVEAAPSDTNDYYGKDRQGIPMDIVLELLSRFQQTMMRASNDLENSKRTVDFGLARGYSGTQEAKHRLGLAAANFPGGPGRRRRSEAEE